MTLHRSGLFTTALLHPHRLFERVDNALGCVGFDVPVDVLLASGRAFFHLPWIKGRATPLADRWLDAVTDEGMAQVVTFRGGTETSSVRDILVHMVEEYARHCGHADLLRECIDGSTGE